MRASILGSYWFLWLRRAPLCLSLNAFWPILFSFWSRSPLAWVSARGPTSQPFALKVPQSYLRFVWIQAAARSLAVNRQAWLQSSFSALLASWWADGCTLLSDSESFLERTCHWDWLRRTIDATSGYHRYSMIFWSRVHLCCALRASFG